MHIYLKLDQVVCDIEMWSHTILVWLLLKSYLWIFLSCLLELANFVCDSYLIHRLRGDRERSLVELINPPMGVNGTLLVSTWL